MAHTLHSFGFGFSTIFNLDNKLQAKTHANIIRTCCFLKSEVLT